MPRLRFILLPILVLITLAAGSWWYFVRITNAYFNSQLTLEAPREYRVHSGDNIPKTITRFVDLGLIAPPYSFLLRIQLKQQALNFGIQRGEFLLQPGITLRQALTKLGSEKTIQRRWTLVEGSTLKQVLPQLEKNVFIDYDLPKIRAFSDYPTLREALNLEYQSPEGLFLANTYFFSRGTKASTLLAQARASLTRLHDQLEEVCNRLPEKGLTSFSRYQRTVLASIIEKETGLASERQKISAVFHNRLTRGMRLQTDPTVIYGLGDAYKGNITKKHLTTPTPYNTYTIHGLPPTPISNVGEASMIAVCNPDQDFITRGMLYFVGKGDGSHYFSTSYAEHQKAVARYQLKRAKDYHSAPQ